MIDAPGLRLACKQASLNDSDSNASLFLVFEKETLNIFAENSDWDRIATVVDLISSKGKATALVQQQFVRDVLSNIKDTNAVISIRAPKLNNQALVFTSNESSSLIQGINPMSGDKQQW
jgi:hypothetical protein